MHPINRNTQLHMFELKIVTVFIFILFIFLMYFLHYYYILKSFEVNV